MSVSNPLVCLSCCRLTWVVHPSLDDIVQSEAGWCLLISKLIVEVRGQHLGHVIVVLAEVRVLLLRLVVQLELVVGVAERHGGGLWTLRADGMLSSDLRTQLLGACSQSDRGLEKKGGSPSLNPSLVRKHQEPKLPNVATSCLCDPAGDTVSLAGKRGQNLGLKPEKDSHINKNNNKNTGSGAGVPLAECLPSKLRALGLVLSKSGYGCSCLKSQQFKVIFSYVESWRPAGGTRELHESLYLNRKELGMVIHAGNSNTLKLRQEDCSEFKGSLGYRNHQELK